MIRQFMTRSQWLFILFIAFIVSSAAHDTAHTTSVSPNQQSAVAGLPEGFFLADLTSGLTLPTDLAIMPNGNMLVTEKGTGDGKNGISNVRLIKNGQLIETPVVSLHTNVIDDSGLLSIVLDNDFANNNYFYLWYGPGTQAKQKRAVDTFRISRFTFDPATGIADPASEVVIHDSVLWTEWHNGGGIGFDKQGNLYIATGDMYDANLPQNLTLRSGKILRIRPTDTGHVIPTDNPYVGINNIPPELYGLGVRNPFRMTRRESDKALFFADVGKWTWEEVSQIKRNANYGWPYREGSCAQGQNSPCDPAPSEFTEPIFAYEHENGKGALTGMAFYEGNSYPAKYRGNLFYVDGDRQYLARVNLESVDKQPERLATSVGFIVDMAYFKNNLYLLDIAEGKVKVLYYSDDKGVAPTLQVQHSTLSGKAPFKIWVDARSSSSPRNLQLRYIWNWGDGSPETLSDRGYRTHTYQADGDYHVTVQAQDVLGATSDKMTIRFRIFSGEMPKIVFANEDRVNASRYVGGDTWSYEAQRSVDVEGLAATPYLWNIYLQHNEHFHPIVSGVTGERGTLKVDQLDHNDEEDVWYRFELVMRTIHNQDIKIQRDLRPTFSHVSIDSIPRPVDIRINGLGLETGYTFRRIEGMVQTIEAPKTIFHNGKVGRFLHWVVLRNGWPLAAATAATAATAITAGPEQDVETIPQAKLTIPIPQRNVTYLANYTLVGPVKKTYFPIISR